MLLSSPRGSEADERHQRRALEASLAVVAHLSEGIPRYWLLDVASLQQFIDTALRFGLGVAVEAKIVADINATSGIQTQAYSTSVLETLLRSITKWKPTGMRRAQLCCTPMIGRRTACAVERRTLSSICAAVRSGITSPVRGARRDDSQRGSGRESRTRPGCSRSRHSHEGVGVQWSENSNADDFSKNLIRARCEGGSRRRFQPVGCRCCRPDSIEASLRVVVPRLLRSKGSGAARGD